MGGAASSAAERRRHFRTQKLSTPALKVVHDGFAEEKSYDAIVAEVAALGEKATRGGLSRYWRFWRAQEKAREAHAGAHKLLREFADRPEDLEQVLEGLLASQIYAGLAEAETKDLYLPDLLKGGAAVMKAQLSRKQLALDREKLDLAKRKFEGALERVGERAKVAGKTLDPDVLRMIREEVYGLPA